MNASNTIQAKRLLFCFKFVSFYMYRKSFNIPWNHQQLCPCNNVFILLFNVVQTGIETITLVEKAHNTNSTGNIFNY